MQSKLWHGLQAYLFALLLHVGHHSHLFYLAYPPRGLRDAGFKKLVALVQREQAALAEDEDKNED